MGSSRDRIVWQPVRNVSGASIAACSLVACVGIDDDGTLQIDVPAANNQTRLFVIDVVPLGIGEYGQAHRQFPTTVGYDTSDGTPSTGAIWGVAAGGVLLRAEQTGYVIVGGAVGGLVVIDEAPGF